MINQIELINFKSHKNTQLNLSNLTVLCGSNAVGKSSAIQALLLLRESFLANSNFDYLDLKCNSINVGTAEDAIYQFAPKNEITFKLITDKNTLTYTFEAKDSELTKTLMLKPASAVHLSDKSILQSENFLDKYCQFISAARLGPQLYYVKDDVVIDIYNQISVIEGKAEHFVHYLNRNKDKSVLKPLINTSIESEDLFYQTIAWEREISNGVNIVIEDLGNLGYELKYQFNTESKEGKTNKFKANNVGFGLSYVMPIIVAILSAPVGSLLLIENPEAHIHPNGQARLSELICLAAQAGIQIIIETHSDHIINGILVQSKKHEENQSGIAKENISIYHFSRNEKEHCSEIQKIDIHEGGKIRYTPKGFFDQFVIDRKFLMGF